MGSRKRQLQRPCREGWSSFSSFVPSRTSLLVMAYCGTTTLLVGYTDSFAPSLLHGHTHRISSIHLDMVQRMGSKGLSRYFQGILSRTRDRQRFVTGKYPVIVSVEENPTQKWLNRDSATSVLLVNDTTLDKSLASYDRFQWLDDVERHELHDRYASISLELLAEIHMTRPGYVHILPSQGPGASAEKVRAYGSTTRWNRFENSTLYQELFLDEILNLPATGHHHHHHHHYHHHHNTNPKDRLWVTGFSLASRKGFVQSMDVDTGHIDSVNQRSEAMTLWPNEVGRVPKDVVSSSSSRMQNSLGVDDSDALLVSDGFLVPGKDRGGVYLVKNPGDPHSEWTVPLTDREGERWFYHRAVWVDLTGDGRKSILTARAKLRKVADDTVVVKGGFFGRFSGLGRDSEDDRRPKNGQLVWLEMPLPHHVDEASETPLEEDGTEFDPFSLRHLPWKEHVLARGPDVMFSVADMDPTDDTIEVISSQFFDKKVTLHSIRRGLKPRVSFARVIDDRCGAAFGGILADLTVNSSRDRTPGPKVLDSGSTVESIESGGSFSHVVVTSHECDYAEKEERLLSQWGLKEEGSSHINRHYAHHHQGVADSPVEGGGSLFTYKVPEGKSAWKTEPWIRTTVASGFKVKGQLWNVINPGAPGFVYTFYAKSDDRITGKRPFIAVAGDCAESAFIFRPEKIVGSKLVLQDPDAQYKLMCEIKCGATVGSIAVGYDNLCSVEQEPGYAKLYIPCYEKDKILVFALGSGNEKVYGDEDDDDDGADIRGVLAQGWRPKKSCVV